MSGIEIAGIILGSIPLVISALEHYYDGVTAIKRLHQYKGERRYLVRNLKVEQTKLQHICEKLLSGLTSPSQVEILIKDPFSNQWDDALLKRRLKGRLGESVDIFQDTISAMRCAITEMMLKLGINPVDQMQLPEPLILKKELKRLLFTISRTEFSDQLSTIRNGVSDLETLIDQSVCLEPKRQERSQVRLLELLRDLSIGLHRALKQSLSCTCGHTLNLKLITRSPEVMHAENETAMLQELDLSLFLSKAGSKPAGGNVAIDENIWTGLRFHALPATGKEVAEPSKSTTALPFAPHSARSKGKRVAFQNISLGTVSPSTSMLVQTTTATATSLSSVLFPATFAVSNLELKKINNLCDDIHNLQKKQQSEYYGFIIDNGSPTARKYTVYAAEPDTFAANEATVVSLRQVLEGREGIPRMTYRERLKLAVTIASSFMQLHDTPWLSGNFSPENIIFLQSENSNLYDNVFIWRGNYDDHTMLMRHTPLSANRNLALLALAFLLLQVFLQQLLCEGEADSFDKQYSQAQGLLREVKFESLNYFSAVSRCLDGELHTAGYDETEFRENLYSGVVALLKKDLSFL